MQSELREKDSRSDARFVVKMPSSFVKLAKAQREWQIQLSAPRRIASTVEPFAKLLGEPSLAAGTHTSPFALAIECMPLVASTQPQDDQAYRAP